MIISIVNYTDTITDSELQSVIRAINRQIAEDFEPYWSFGARLRLEGKASKAPGKETLSELRGDAVIYLWDKTDVDNALGYHANNAAGIPYGFVFTELSTQQKENWTVTLSHEALELLGDAQGNLLVQGPHPADPKQQVFHWFEMCDAVQSQTYRVDGVEVANFVLPLYFTTEEQKGGRNDFLCLRDKKGVGLKSFGVTAGGYIGFYDPSKGSHDTYFAPGDAKAQKRIQLKTKNFFGRGYLRSHGKAADTLKNQRSTASYKLKMASATAATDPIKHVVVLMMENRSFDHMLGGMKRINPLVEGIPTPAKSNTSGSNRAKQQPIAASSLAKDLDHEHAGVMQQMGTPDDPMSGFIASYLARYPRATQNDLDQVMAYFNFGITPDDDSLPALHGLARHFTVCDHWFSSMPGPTWQNRFFVHSGTCLGHVQMPSLTAPRSWDFFYFQETIFDRLSDAGIHWKIYHDGLPQSIVLARLLPAYLSGRGYDPIQTFFTQAKGDADSFPEYAFIEPKYFSPNENDQHPPSHVLQGDALIAQVYNALRENEALWQSTLLVILYDEHGGFYDHVLPPATVAPDGHTSEWTFDQLGVRVPALLVSPWVDADVVSTVFDHTSLLRYLCEKWNLPPLGRRMQASAGALQSNTFADVLRTSARTDTPLSLTVPAIRAAAVEVDSPLDGSRAALLQYIQQLPEPGVAVPAGQVLGVRGKPKAAAKETTGTVPLMSPAEAEAKLARLREASAPE